MAEERLGAPDRDRHLVCSALACSPHFRPVPVPYLPYLTLGPACPSLCRVRASRNSPTCFQMQSLAVNAADAAFPRVAFENGPLTATARFARVSAASRLRAATTTARALDGPARRCEREHDEVLNCGGTLSARNNQAVGRAPQVDQEIIARGDAPQEAEAAGGGGPKTRTESDGQRPCAPDCE